MNQCLECVSDLLQLFHLKGQRLLEQWLVLVNSKSEGLLAAEFPETMNTAMAHLADRLKVLEQLLK